MSYNIVRMFFNGPNKVIKRNVTLEEAQEHCKDPETSSRTCTDSSKKRITKDNGPWFDGYEES